MDLTILMKYLLIPTLMIVLCAKLFAQDPAVEKIHAHTHQHESKQSLLKFIPNKNQWNSTVKYRAEIPGGYLYLKDQALKYVLYDQEAIRAIHPQSKNNAVIPQKIRGHSFEVQFLNTKTHLELRASKPQVTKYNYFIGNEPQKWASDLKAYQQIEYLGLYAGINLQIHQHKQTLKYEFQVLPYANAAQILMEYKGAEALSLKEENLIIQTSVGQIIEKKPYCYQIKNGKEVSVPSRFVLKGNQVHFEFPEGYDETLALVIDPELVFSTYSGSTADNWGSTATFDNEGNLYSGGIAFAPGFPVTTGAFDTSFNDATDIALLKFNPTGTQLLYATYLGGNNAEFPHSMIVDNQNNLLILGTSGSTNYPTTTGAFQNTFGGGTLIEAIGGITYSLGSDVVISKLNSTGSQLIASTFIGGSGNDGLNPTRTDGIFNYGDVFRGEIITGDDNSIYVASVSRSANFPVVNASQGTLRGLQDGVVFRMNSTLTNLLWSTYLGGGSFEAAYSLKLNLNGDLYVCGGTNSNDLRAFVPAGAGVPLFANRQGGDDGFIARLTAAGQLRQITYLGTTAHDQTFLIDFDEEGNPHVVGQTLGSYPVSAGVYSNPNGKQFIDKINPDLSERLLSTVVGTDRSTPNITFTAFLVNDCSNVYIAGWGGITGGSLSTSGLPTTPDAYDRTTGGSDFYIMILEKDFQSLVYATFIGGSSSGNHVDGGTSRFSKEGVIYHAACASCGGIDNDFPTTPGAWSATNNSDNCNNAAFKFDIGSLSGDFDILDAALGNVISQGCTFPLETTFDFEGQGVTTWEWRVDGQFAGDTPNINWTFTENGVYEIQLTIGNPASCLQEIVLTKLFPVSRISVDASYAATICDEESIELQAEITSSAPFTFSWSPSIGLDNPNALNPNANPAQSTNYTLTATDENGCIAQKVVEVTVIPPLADDFEIRNSFGILVENDCVPTDVTFIYNTPTVDNPTWVWEIEGFGTFENQTNLVLNFTETGEYTIRLTATRGGQCPDDVVIEKTLVMTELSLEVSPDVQICFGESTQLLAEASNNSTYTWTPTTGLSNPNIPNPIASPTQTTEYTVRIQNEVGCIRERKIVVEVFPQLILDIELQVGSDCAKPSVLKFINNSTGADRYEWSISNGEFFTEATPSDYTFAQGGTYEVSVRAFNGNDECQAFETFVIEVEDNQTLPPNAITPALKDGDNDTFQISQIRPNYGVEIYNRWGGLIYENPSYQDEWGEGVSAGVYYYVLISPKGVKCRGWVEVIR